MNEERLDTAHEVWERRWGQADGRAQWSEPEVAVMEFIPRLQGRGASVVVDVGAGVGRHALAYARAGLGVFASDASATGLRELARSARTEGVRVDMTIAPRCRSKTPAWIMCWRGT